MHTIKQMETLEELKNIGFTVKESSLAGEKVYLVFPYTLGIPWNHNLLRYRSSIWTKDMRPVSLGFKKFFNLGEASHLIKDPTDNVFKNGKVKVVEKIDGSCLIVSKYKGKLITRTRGVFDASSQGNGCEIAHLRNKYPAAFNNFLLNEEEYSLIYEWVTPTNRIILNYGETPDIKLIGAINHNNYEYMSQEDLDNLAKAVGVSRPQYLHMQSLNELLEHLKTLKHAEGYCLYFNNDQDIKKIKCSWYLSLHKFKSNCNIEYILDFFLINGCPPFEEFKEALKENFDFECFPDTIRFASKISDAYKKVENILNGMHKFISKMDANSKEGRKAAAEQIREAYGVTNRATYAFALLDKKTLSKDQIKKLIFQCF